MKKNLILISGFSGVGKSYLSTILERKGYIVTSASSILRKECSIELGDNVSRDILREYGKKMLVEQGEEYFANLLIKNLDLTKADSTHKGIPTTKILASKPESSLKAS